MALHSNYAILRSLPEIEAFFWRIAPFVDAGRILARVEMGPSLARIGGYADLAGRAGESGAVDEIIAEIARVAGDEGLPDLVLFPSGLVAVLGYFGADEPDGDDPVIRAVICPAEAGQADAVLPALAQVLLGLRDCVAARPAGRVPLPARRTWDWPAAVAALFDRDALERAYEALVTARKDGEPPRLSASRRDVIEPHIRWFAESRKAFDDRKAADRMSGKRAARGSPPVGRSAAAPIDLKRHIINMRHGELSQSGFFQTSASDVEQIARSARDWIDGGAGRRLVLYAHGGLVGEAKAVTYAQDTAHWWLENDVYPVFCIWESDAITAIMQLVREALGDGRRGPLDWSELRDAAIERLVHALGRPVWDVMKRSAARCSADGQQFGLTLFAGKLKAAFAGRDLPLDLVGHSAGSILMLHFLARLKSEAMEAQSFQTLAPAATCRLYADMLARLDSDTLKTRIYAMDDATERKDSVADTYGKSLLYLVSRGFEDQFGEQIAGLQKDLLADARLVKRLSRWSNGVTRESMVFSPSLAGTPKRLSAASTSHGGFDDDPDTMWSVMALIRGEADEGKISRFPTLEEGHRSRDARALQFDLPEELRTYLSLARSAAPGGGGGGGGNGGGGGPSAAPLAMSSVPAMAHQGAKLALSIGINEYASANRLEGCVNDSNAWSQLLSSRGFHVTQLIRPEETGRDQIVQQLRDFVARSGAGDTLVWHFSGHGMEIEGTIGDDNDFEVKGVDQAIVASNASASLQGQLKHAIMDDELHSILQGLNRQAACYVFLDSCHSGSGTRFVLPGKPRTVGTLSGVSRSSRGRLLTPPMTASARGGPYDGANHVLFSACSATQVALENGVPRQGSFTRAVCDLLARQTEPLTNQLFSQKINDLIPGSDQTPGVYCDPSRREQPFPLVGV